MQTKQKLLSALILGAFASGASASGFQLIEQNASGLGNSYAGSAAVAENASTIFYNPAGMMELKDREVSLGMAVVKPSFKFKDSGTSTGATSGGANDAGTWGYVPNGYASWSYNKDVRLGIGISAPFGLMTKYNNNWVGSAQSISFDVQTLNINPSIAFRLNDTTSIGGGVNWQRIEATYYRTAGLSAAALPFPLSALVTTGQLQASHSRMTLSGETWGWNAGVLFKLSPDTRLGISYRSQMRYKAQGTVSVTGPNATLNGATSSGVQANINLPDTLIASLSHQLDPRWQLLGDISWTGWSSIPQIDIYRNSGSASGALAQTLDTNFRNTWRVAVGANYKYSDDWKLKMGIAYDQTPVKNAESRLASMPDNDRLWLSVGTQWQVTKDSTIDLGLAYLYLKDAKINNDQSTKNRGTVIGTYNDSGLILGAQYSAAF